MINVYIFYLFYLLRYFLYFYFIYLFLFMCPQVSEVYKPFPPLPGVFFEGMSQLSQKWHRRDFNDEIKCIFGSYILRQKGLATALLNLLATDVDLSVAKHKDLFSLCIEHKANRRFKAHKLNLDIEKQIHSIVLNKYYK